MIKDRIRIMLMISMVSIVFFYTCKKEELPVLTTDEISDLGLVSATSGGNISSDGDPKITARGVCWANHDEPTISDNITSDGKGTGIFTSTLSGLISGTKYYVRAYATNSAGTSYGKSVSFTTYTLMDIDKNGYHSVKIGTQEWLVENLKVTHFQNGDIITNASSATEWSNLTSPGYCYYKNESANLSIYGNLYNFYVAHDSRNVCPAGWHVPSMDEWVTLFTSFGSETVADVKLREAGTAHWISNTGADNSTGFTMLPGGNRESDGTFFNLGSRANVWSSLEHSENGIFSGWLIGMEWDRSLIRSNPYTKSYGASIRCIKN